MTPSLPHNFQLKIYDLDETSKQYDNFFRLSGDCFIRSPKP